jgi:hypothetical protein
VALALVVTLFTALAGAPLAGAEGHDVAALDRHHESDPRFGHGHDRCRADVLGVLHEAADERMTSPDLATHASIPLPEGSETFDDFERHARALVLLALARHVHVETEVLAPRESEASTPRHASIDIRSLRGPPRS